MCSRACPLLLRKAGGWGWGAAHPRSMNWASKNSKLTCKLVEVDVCMKREREKHKEKRLREVKE